MLFRSEASISPLARRVLGLFPAPNRAGSNNYLGQPTGITEQTQADFRVDHQFGTGRGLMVRYSDGKVHLLEPYAEGTAVTAGYGNYVDDRTWNGTVQYQHLWTSVANSVRFGANGFSRDVTTENRATDVGALWNVNWLGVPSASFGYPLVDVAGYTRVGDAYSLPILRDTKTFQIADDVSFDRGAHLIKMGGEGRSIRLNSRLDLFSRGQLPFSEIGRAHV